MHFVFIQELGKQKCYVYWPQETGHQHIQKCGDVSFFRIVTRLS